MQHNGHINNLVIMFYYNMDIWDELKSITYIIVNKSMNNKVVIIVKVIMVNQYETTN